MSIENPEQPKPEYKPGFDKKAINETFDAIEANFRKAAEELGLPNDLPKAEMIRRVLEADAAREKEGK